MLMSRPTANPRQVDWAGENPGIYLKETADGPYVTLVSFFRVVLSPHGRGHAAFILLDPDGDGADPLRPNVCATDNEPMAEWLRDGFVRHFLAFRKTTGLDRTRIIPGWDFVAGGDGRTEHVEWFRTSLGQVQLAWKDWGAKYEVELTDGRAVTGKHEMFSTFVDVHRAEGYLNGRPFPGRPFPREFAGRKDSSTAFLAFAETWLHA
jgi:hypothetical protein